MRQSESLVNFSKAFVAVQAALKPAVKDSNNPHFKSKYADLASVWDACKEPLTKNGFAVIQCPEKKDDCVVIITRLLHSSGEFIESELTMKPMDTRPQSDGSAITYGRRYALAAMVGVCPDDDDGNDASGRGEPPRQQAQPKANGKANTREAVNDTIPVNAKNAVYMTGFKWKFGKLVKDAGESIWATNDELKNWAGEYKVEGFKTWDEVEACTEADRLQRLLEAAENETKARKAALQPAGAL